jgi:hypothetical protein
MLFMRKSFEHGRSVEVPERAFRHNIESKGAEDGEIECCIYLLHESPLLCAAFYPTFYRRWADESLHHKLPGKTEDHGVKCHEGNIRLTLAIHIRAPWIVWTQWVGEENGFVKRILFSRTCVVGTEDGNDDNEGIEPSMLERNMLPFSKR